MNEIFAYATGEGFSMLESGRFEEARSAFKKACIDRPGNSLVWYGMGFAQVRAGLLDNPSIPLARAVVAANRMTAIRVISETHLTIGLLYRRAGDHAAGRDAYRRALLAEPSNAQAWNNLANLYTDNSKTSLAVAAAWRAVRAKPDYAAGWNNLTRLLTDQGRLSETVGPQRRCLVVTPGDRHGWINFAIVAKRQNHLNNAVNGFGRAVLVDPEDSEARMNLGRNLLLTGDLEKGWCTLEHDWRRQGFPPMNRGFSLPVWDGGAVHGGRLLVWCEEKIGEEIMFASMLPDVYALAGSLLFLSSPRVHQLFARSFPYLDIIAWDGAGRPPADLSDVRCCYPLEYVGRHLRRQFKEFPKPRAYLRPSTSMSLGAMSRGLLRVGLSWHSTNPLVGIHQSLALEQLGPILRIEGARFVDLQYGNTNVERGIAEDCFGVTIDRPDSVDQIADIEGFADFVAGLDLVISISNTTVHVAGALGVETWVMLPKGPGLPWVWFEDHDVALWYPRTKLFRQETPGDWRPVIDEVAKDLRRFVAASD
ncbi:MAG: hypothetical protein CMM47_11725 [Rhodospirillaceae bacterium]|nr:hypothetical protein [Rhodospirillaceae bacterium]